MYEGRVESNLSKMAVSSSPAVFVEERNPEHAKFLVPELCRLFYQHGWVTGTGGGISIRMNGKVYVAPSGVQKERIQPHDLFVLSEDGKKVLEAPLYPGLKISECTPLFFNAYKLRSAGACLHTHSQNCVMVSMQCGKEFRISHVEMIKGIRNASTGKALGFRDTLVVPIIENTDFEKDLTESMAAAMRAYPDTNAVIVRRHGCYIWGDTWQRAKGMVECYDYLFEVALKMMAAGVPLVRPKEASKL